MVLSSVIEEKHMQHSLLRGFINVCGLLVLANGGSQGQTRFDLSKSPWDQRMPVNTLVDQNDRSRTWQMGIYRKQRPG